MTATYVLLALTASAISFNAATPDPVIDHPEEKRMTSRAGKIHTAAADVATTLTGIAFWTILLAAAVVLFSATIVSVVRAPLGTRSRTRWMWLVALAPGFGIILWFAKGWSSARNHG